MRKDRILLLVWLTFGSDLRADVVINEIMYNPTAGDSNYEYVELYNTGDETVDLTNWTLNESTGTEGVYKTYTFTSAGGQPTQIAPGGYLIVTNAPDEPGDTTFRTEYSNTPVGTPVVNFEMQLINTPDSSNPTWPTEQIILDSDSNLGNGWVDKVTYDDVSPWPAQNEGISIELLSPGLDNSQGNNWSWSLVSGGTPGQINSVTPEPSTFALFASGLGAVFWRRRKRRR